MCLVSYVNFLIGQSLLTRIWSMNYLCVFTKWISYTLSVPAVNLREGIFFFFPFSCWIANPYQETPFFSSWNPSNILPLFLLSAPAKEEKVESRVIQKQNHPNYGDYLIVFAFYPSDLRFWDTNHMTPPEALLSLDPSRSQN